MSDVKEQKIRIEIKVGFDPIFRKYYCEHDVEKIIARHSKNYIYKGIIETPAGYCSDKETNVHYIIDKKDLEAIEKDLKESDFRYTYSRAVLIHRWE